MPTYTIHHTSELQHRSPVRALLDQVARQRRNHQLHQRLAGPGGLLPPGCECVSGTAAGFRALKSNFWSAKVKSCCSEGDTPSSLGRKAPEFRTKELDGKVSNSGSLPGIAGRFPENLNHELVYEHIGYPQRK